MTAADGRGTMSSSRAGPSVWAVDGCRSAPFIDACSAAGDKDEEVNWDGTE